MAHLSDLYVTTTSDGRELLRFSATIVNVGSGAFELAASRPDTGSPWSVSQRVSQSDGSTVAVPTSADMIFDTGDHHSHWHVRDLESYDLLRLDNGVKVGAGVKTGFCFFDTHAYELSLPGAPSQGVYRPASCGSHDSLDVSMGLSVGWGDKYPWNFSGQYIDITSIDNGKYRLRATADQLGLFAEANETNNETWLDIMLSRRNDRTSVKVLGYGPDALNPAEDSGSGGSNNGKKGNPPGRS
ncbi:MAG: hypothetical protein GEV04_21435 [Actinophytocola sp.]|nr:hypothetical protein [Actinophytocola sp.]